MIDSESFLERCISRNNSKGISPIDDDIADLIQSCGLKQASVAVILFDYKNAVHVLLTKRSNKLRSHPGETAFPGGRKDPEDVDEHACAIREMNEEIGLDPKYVSKSDLTVCPQISLHGILVSVIVLKLASEIIPLLPPAGEKFTELFDERDLGEMRQTRSKRAKLAPIMKANPGEVDCIFHLPVDVVLKKMNISSAVECRMDMWFPEHLDGYNRAGYNIKFVPSNERRFGDCPNVTGLTAHIVILVALKLLEKDPEWLDSYAKTADYNTEDPDRFSRTLLRKYLQIKHAQCIDE